MTDAKDTSDTPDNLAQGRASAPGPGSYPPVTRLTVLYDAGCPLCVHLRHWLQKQRQLVPLDLVPAGSQEARDRFPGLDHAGTLEEITVVGDRWQVYRGSAAWIVCLWALAEHRPRAHWLTTPLGRPFARATVLAAAKYRSLTAEPCASADGPCRLPDPVGGSPG
ncbi:MULTISPECIES: thiol-disulfide oxidoreductase DCC family protein [Streptomyces]|uniref:Thiol-disulfide oxidoreductase DCC family protein n=1 Tax=Streptomyces mutomycini TaxID=284036 RepID=A0ABW0AXK0_9ACTN|nr:MULTISPECIES: DCC1-like thiol-disulfide oxidoreductase family protein [Streptomyces]